MSVTQNLVRSDEEAYEVLRSLASPLVALTVRRGEKRNGMIANSAIRASLVPGQLRVANYVLKRHLTHEMLVETGRYVMHLLGREQWDEIWQLGFESGRGRDKLEGLEVELREGSGLPVLSRCWAWMECRVVNVMDAGSSTFFMGEIEAMGRGSARDLMDSGWFREHMPEAWREPYRRNLEEVQRWSEGRLEEIDDSPWRRLREAGEGA